MKLVKRIKILSVFLLFCSLSCEKESHIEYDKLAYIYVDLLIVRDYYSNSDSLAFKRKEVFDKYMITEEIYDSSFRAFDHDQEEWEYFFNLANAYLDSLKVQEKAGKLKSVP